ncbi:MAG: hypothetical protein KA821_13015 [Chitinophagaceae bacterium]|nr:hypothetical protein [Chitinophagaceae bacterium]
MKTLSWQHVNNFSGKIWEVFREKRQIHITIATIMKLNQILQPDNPDILSALQSRFTSIAASLFPIRHILLLNEDSFFTEPFSGNRKALSADVCFSTPLFSSS